jgi:hypothetical protein
MKSGIREGDVVYIRARATRAVTFYEGGVSQDGVSVIPISRDGATHDALLAPPEAVISAKAIESAVTKAVKERYGIK